MAQPVDVADPSRGYVDGEKINPHDRFVFRRYLLEDVPNAAWCMGYTNASWTLGADLTARSVAKLLAYMDSHGYTHAFPHLGNVHMPEQPAFNLQSGYVLRSLDVLPKSGTRRPWLMSHNFMRDVLGRPFESIEESMVFGRAATASAGSADTAFGKLGSRIDPKAQGSYWELASDQHLPTSCSPTRPRARGASCSPTSASPAGYPPLAAARGE